MAFDLSELEELETSKPIEEMAKDDDFIALADDYSFTKRIYYQLLDEMTKEYSNNSRLFQIALKQLLKDRVNMERYERELKEMGYTENYVFALKIAGLLD